MPSSPRRWCFSSLLVFAALIPGEGAEAAARNRTVHDFRVRTIEGREVSLSQYKGRTLLIVNTASRCGFTGQYEGLQALYDTYRARGFEVLAFPANDFMGQEPGTDGEIQKFCTTRYSTTFPLFSKISVKGSGMHPLYAHLTRESAFPGDVRWNFGKFLVGPDGRVVARFDPKVKPQAAELTAAIERSLAAR